MRLVIVWFFLMVVAEIWSIIQVGHHIGALATLVLLASGFIFGLQLMRSQGINALMQRAQSVQPGESRLAPLAEGVVKAFAGILLIIPGFVSDVIALLILLPMVRKGFAAYLARKGRFQGFAAGSFGNGGFNGAFGAGGFTKPEPGNIYEHKASSAEADEGRILEHEPNKKN